MLRFFPFLLFRILILLFISDLPDKLALQAESQKDL